MLRALVVSLGMFDSQCHKIYITDGSKERMAEHLSDFCLDHESGVEVPNRSNLQRE
jgi:hypothetical protein